MAIKSMGTLLKIGSTAVAEVTGVSDTGISKEATDVSNLSSAAKEFLSTGLVDGGEISVTGFFNPNDTAGQKALYDAVISGAILAMSVLWVNAVADWTFNAIVTEFKVGAEMEGTLPFDCKLKVTGLPALGVTASGGLTGLALTGAGGSISPAFGAAVRYYTYGGVSATSVTVTATAASHTLKLYIDGAYSQDLTTATPSSAISLTINVGKKLTIIAYEAGKTQQVTEIVVVKTS